MGAGILSNVVDGEREIMRRRSARFQATLPPMPHQADRQPDLEPGRSGSTLAGMMHPQDVPAYRLREARKVCGMGLEHAAQSASMVPLKLHLIETNKLKPTFADVRTLSLVYRVRLHWISGFVDDPEPEYYIN